MAKDYRSLAGRSFHGSATKKRHFRIPFAGDGDRVVPESKKKARKRADKRAREVSELYAEKQPNLWAPSAPGQSPFSQQPTPVRPKVGLKDGESTSTQRAVTTALQSGNSGVGANVNRWLKKPQATIQNRAKTVERRPAHAAKVSLWTD